MKGKEEESTANLAENAPRAHARFISEVSRMGVIRRDTGNLPVEHGRVAHATASARSCERPRAQNTRKETVLTPNAPRVPRFFITVFPRWPLY